MLVIVLSMSPVDRWGMNMLFTLENGRTFATVICEYVQRDTCKITSGHT